jgi:SOS-response transcriptional repressor LexA
MAKPRDPNLTMRQVQTVATIRNFIHCHGHSPTIRELSELLDRSRGTVQQRLRSLVAKGVLAHVPEAHRTLEIIPLKPPKKALPEFDAIDDVDSPPTL